MILPNWGLAHTETPSLVVQPVTVVKLTWSNTLKLKTVVTTWLNVLHAVPTENLGNTSVAQFRVTAIFGD